MASATAAKTLGGQTQNLRNIIDLASLDTRLKKGIVLVSEIVTSWIFLKSRYLTGKCLETRKLFKSQ